MRKAKKNKLSKEAREALYEHVDKFGRMFDELMLTPFGQAVASFHNSQVREKTLEKIMWRRFGKDWEDYLHYDLAAIPPGGTYRPMDVKVQPYGELKGECLSAMLETLDRRGRLVAGLPLEEVQAAAERENRLWAEGEKTGRGRAIEHDRPANFDSTRLGPICLEIALVFGVEADFEIHGASWLDGFICGITHVWEPLPDVPEEGEC